MSQTLALLGANSQIARDLICRMGRKGEYRLLLYVRDVGAMQDWVSRQSLVGEVSVYDYGCYHQEPHDVVMNFVGVGDPLRAAEMGVSIAEITRKFDDLALSGLEMHPARKYLFLSSGAVYGNAFSSPVSSISAAHIGVNQVLAQDFYALAKLQAEVGHRLRPDQAIVDLRIFNYFSRTQDISARFFITDLVRAIKEGRTATVSPDFMVRDFLHPDDFYQLVECLIKAPPTNQSLDCYTSSPIEKSELLSGLKQHFGLNYEVSPANQSAAVNATGLKTHYYSLDRRAAQFGYVPTYSSLSGIVEEISALLS